MSSLDTIPIIRMEVERMQYTMRAALTEHIAQIDEQVKEEFDRFCKPENMRPLIREKTHLALKDALTEEINAFFKYGNGRKAISDLFKQIFEREWRDMMKHAVSEFIEERFGDRS